MISYLNVKQLEALTEIPSSLVINRNGTPNGTIFFSRNLTNLQSLIIKSLNILKNLQSPPLKHTPTSLILSARFVVSLVIKSQMSVVGLLSLANAI